MSEARLKSMHPVGEYTDYGAVPTKRFSGSRGKKETKMTKFGRTTALALMACGAAMAVNTSSYAAEYHRVLQQKHAYGSEYGGLRDDDSENAKNPALPSYAQNKGHETGGPGRMQIPY
jgi:hypothetical protein